MEPRQAESETKGEGDKATEKSRQTEVEGLTSPYEGNTNRELSKGLSPKDTQEEGCSSW